MTLNEVMQALSTMGDENSKKVLMRHGAREPFYGVKVQDLKILQKRIKKDYNLSLELYNTGNSDAMYLASLIADPPQMTKEQIEQWAKQAYWYMLSEYPVAWVASESQYGWSLALEWIESPLENIATAGWATLSCIAAIKPDYELDLNAYKQLLERVQNEIGDAPNRVRYTMNNFIISVGAYIVPLYSLATQIALSVGKVNVNMGQTACKVPLASEYIQKIFDMGKVGKKRKSARC